MKFKFLFVIIICFFVSSCVSNKQKQIINIQQLEGEFYQLKSIDQPLGTQLVEAYVQFADQFQDDTLCPVYLFKAADVAMNLEMSEQAIQYFEKVNEKYPEFEKAPECLFLVAFIYENKLHDMQNAEKFYKDFLDQYPEHVLASDARAALKYLGMSPEELVRLFQEQGSN